MIEATATGAKLVNIGSKMAGNLPNVFKTRREVS
jgi:hypothetical protein